MSGYFVEVLRCGSCIKDFAILIEERQKYGKEQCWHYRNGGAAGSFSASKLSF